MTPGILPKACLLSVMLSILATQFGLDSASAWAPKARLVTGPKGTQAMSRVKALTPSVTVDLCPGQSRVFQVSERIASCSLINTAVFSNVVFAYDKLAIAGLEPGGGKMHIIGDRKHSLILGTRISAGNGLECGAPLNQNSDTNSLTLHEILPVSTIKMLVGSEQCVHFSDDRLTGVLLSNPAVADFKLAGKGELLVRAIAGGVTNLFAYASSDKVVGVRVICADNATDFEAGGKYGDVATDAASGLLRKAGEAASVGVESKNLPMPIEVWRSGRRTCIQSRD